MLKILLYPFNRLECSVRQVTKYQIKTSRPQDFREGMLPVKRIDPMPFMWRKECKRIIIINIFIDKRIPAQDIVFECPENQTCPVKFFVSSSWTALVI